MRCGELLAILLSETIVGAEAGALAMCLQDSLGQYLADQIRNLPIAER